MMGNMGSIVVDNVAETVGAAADTTPEASWDLYEMIQAVMEVRDKEITMPFVHQVWTYSSL